MDVVCSTGKRVLGGGYDGSRIVTDKSEPYAEYNANPGNNGWRVAGNASLLGGSVVAFAICADV